jgi:uncharacterized protein YigE (DUF2233 family)
VKRIILLSTILTVIVVIMFRYMIPTQKTTPAPHIPDAPTPTLMHNKVKTVPFGSDQYAYDFFTVTNPATLLLIPNFSHPKDAESLISENHCTAAITGGFYDKQQKPLGYFQTGETIIGTKIDSALVNGFFWADASGSAVISTDLPRTDFHFALQSGPVLMFDGKVLPLSINNDKPARRMAVARSINNSLIFFTVYTEQSVFDGPLLADFPEIIGVIGRKEKMNILEAINLDGGSASAFYSADTKLPELTPVGSIFCFRTVKIEQSKAGQK